MNSVVSYVDTGEKHPIRLKRISKNKVTDFCQEFPEPSWGSRRQILNKLYQKWSHLFNDKKLYFTKKSRWGSKTYPMIMPDVKSVNIDTKHDLLIAKLLIQMDFAKINH